MPEEEGRRGPHAAGGKGGRELGWGSASGGHPSPCVPGADGVLCPHAQGPSPCRPQEPAGPPAPGTGAPSAATHRAGLAPPRPGPSGHTQDPLGQGTRQRAPTVTALSPSHRAWWCPRSTASQHTWPCGHEAPSAQHALRGLSSARPSDWPQRRLHGPARLLGCPHQRPARRPAGSQSQLRATRKDGGSETLKGLTQPAAPTETQNFKRRALIRRAPGASDTWGAVLDPGTRQSSHWGDGAQTCTETRTVIGGAWSARSGRQGPAEAPRPERQR